MGLILILLVLSLPGIIAAMKGRSFFLWLVYGCVLFPVALIHALFMHKEASNTNSTTNKSQSIGAKGKRLDPAGIEYSGLKLPLHIRYKDEKGEITERDITVRQVNYGYTYDDVLVPYVLEAYCRLRRADRTFYVERILECSDPATKATISDLTDFFKTYFKDSKPPYRRANQLFAVQPTPLLICYQFRKPKYIQQNITVVRIGFYQGINHNPPRRTLSYIEGIREGGTEIERFNLHRLGDAYDPETGEWIENLSDYLISRIEGASLLSRADI
ncbi:hypothetical protein [Komagataeibacter saccharivorans]|uniref:hypothetical protein n=1 Tax=Komagataeibacter saccharivorans TaxID=265959 RepID=UPI0039E8B167